MEMTENSKLEIITILYQVPFNLGHASLPLFAYFLRDWRYLHFSFSIISVIYLIYPCTIYESPRWLFITGRLDKATIILKRIAKWNRMPTEQIEDQLEQDYNKYLQEPQRSKSSVIDLFVGPNNLCRKTIILLYQWISNWLVFYGAAEFVAKLNGNIFLHVFISGILGIPANAVSMATTKHMGRRLALFFSTLFTAISFLMIAIAISFSRTMVIGCALLGVFGTWTTATNLYLYSGEIFPTVVRSTGIGLCVSAGQLGSMVAPFITSDIGARLPYMPPLIYAITSFLAFGLTFQLPETIHMSVPNTLEDGENDKPLRKKILQRIRSS